MILTKEIVKHINESDFCDYPVFFPNEKYECAIQEYILQIRRVIHGKFTIYQVGSIGVLGLSDIDLFVVIDDENKFVDINKLSIGNLSTDAKYLFMHNCWFVNKESFEGLYYWFPYFNIRPILGDEVDLNKNQHSIISIFIQTQYLINKLPLELFSIITKNKSIPIRNSIAILNSIKHSKKMLLDVGIDSLNKYDQFDSQINKLRMEWFSTKDELRLSQLKELIIHGIEISYNMISNLSDELVNIYNIKSNHEYTLKTNTRKLHFTNNWKSNLKNRSLSDLSKNSFLPSSLYYYFELLSQQTFGYAQNLKLKSSENFIFNKEWIELFSIHYSMINSYNEFSKRKFLTTGHGYHTMWAAIANNNFAANRIKVERRLRKYYDSF